MMRHPSIFIRCSTFQYKWNLYTYFIIIMMIYFILLIKRLLFIRQSTNGGLSWPANECRIKWHGPNSCDSNCQLCSIIIVALKQKITRRHGQFLDNVLCFISRLFLCIGWYLRLNYEFKYTNTWKCIKL